MTGEPLVSVVIPTKNSRETIEICLGSIEGQTYPIIEVLLVDHYSDDGTLEIAKKFNAKIIKSTTGRSEARNIGAKNAAGGYFLFLDSDMQLTPRVVEECVMKVDEGYVAIIVPEVSVGLGFWARCKTLEKSCYVTDDSIEAPRFFKKEIFESVQGYDSELEAGEDWDLGQRIKKAGHNVGRTDAFVKHHEGNLSFWRTVKKKYEYGKTLERYKRKNPNEANRQLNPIRYPLARNWRKHTSNPILVFGMFFMKTCEFAAGWLGFLKGRSD